MSAAEELDNVASIVLAYLESKSLFTAAEALRADVASSLQEDDSTLAQKNICVSELERILEAHKHRVISDITPFVGVTTSTPDYVDGYETRAVTLEALQELELAEAPRKGKAHSNASVAYWELKFNSVVACDHHTYPLWLKRYGSGSLRDNVVFHDAKPFTSSDPACLATLAVPYVFHPHINSLEESRELEAFAGDVFADRYRVITRIGSGSFSSVVQCLDLRTQRMVAVKILRNDKDCFDQGLLEIKLLADLRRHDPDSEQPVQRLLDYFYAREHLFIVTELLRDSLFQFYRYLHATQGGGRFFTPSVIAAIATQLLDALVFVHANKLIHCDVKPQNVCLVSVSKRLVRLIDFGSAVSRHDSASSYVQSRWYRAPEVMLGIPWDEKVDLWSLGCLLSELILGRPIFQCDSPAAAAVLAAQQALLGPHPRWLLDAADSRLAEITFSAHGSVYMVDPPGQPRGVYNCVLRQQRSLAELLGGDPLLVSFIESLLAYDPAQRPSAAAAKDHPFLRAHATDKERHPKAVARSPARRRSSGDSDASSVLGYESSSSGSSAVSAPNTESSASDSERSSRDSSPKTAIRGGGGRAQGTGSSSRRHGRPKTAKVGRGPGLPEAFRRQLEQGSPSTSRASADKTVRGRAFLPLGASTLRSFFAAEAMAEAETRSHSATVSRR